MLYGTLSNAASGATLAGVYGVVRISDVFSKAKPVQKQGVQYFFSKQFPTANGTILKLATEETLKSNQ